MTISSDVATPATAEMEGRSVAWVWDLYYAVGFAVVIPLMLARDSPSLPDRVGVAVALAAMYAVYLGYGRAVTLSGERGRRAVPFAVALLILLGVQVAFAPGAPAAWFAFFPMVFMSNQLRVAIPAAVVASVLPAFVTVIRRGLDAPSLSPLLIIGTVTAVGAPAMAAWIAHIISRSGERARLIEQLEASQAQAAALSHEAGMATERTRLAGEIHDTLAQGFTSIVALARAMESEVDTDPVAARRHLAMIVETAQENLHEARAMVATMQPKALDADSLPHALERHGAKVAERTGLAVQVSADGVPALPRPVEVVVLRGAQEALTNVAKHADARHVAVTLQATDASVRLTVTDDGQGFDPAAQDDHAGYGLRGMRARAEALGGTLHLVSAPGEGTTLTLDVRR